MYWNISPYDETDDRDMVISSVSDIINSIRDKSM